MDIQTTTSSVDPNQETIVSDVTTTPDTTLVYAPPEPVPILTIQDLLTLSEVIKSNEETDTKQLRILKNIDEQDVRNKVITWAASGFPDAWTLYSFQCHKSERCSDGIVRKDVLDYYTFLFPDESLTEILASLQQRLPGMQLTYSYTSEFTISIHISKV